MRMESEIWKFMETKFFAENGMCFSMIFCACAGSSPKHSSVKKMRFFICWFVFVVGLSFAQVNTPIDGVQLQIGAPAVDLGMDVVAPDAFHIPGSRKIEIGKHSAVDGAHFQVKTCFGGHGHIDFPVDGGDGDRLFLFFFG